MSKHDAVKHPSHYVEGRKFEPKDVIRDWGLNFNLGNAVKYIARAGRKGDIIEDLKKVQEYVQFEIDAIEAEREKAVKPKAPIHPNCKCSVHPVFAEMEGGKGVSCGVIELEVPKGTPPEDIIKLVLDNIHEKVQKEEKQAEDPKDNECNIISLETLAGMTATDFTEKYLKPKKVQDLEVTAGSKRYSVNTVDRNVRGVTGGFFEVMRKKEIVHIELTDKKSGSTLEINLED